MQALYRDRNKELRRIKGGSCEAEVFLLLSRVSPPGSALKEAHSLISEDFNWNELLSQSVRHGTSNIIYKNLLKLSDISAHILDTFKNGYNNTLRHNIQLVSEMDKILQALDERGIEAIPLKGPIASEVYFGDIGLYPGGDIDILVHLGDIDGTREYLESEGYALLDMGFDDYRDYYISELYHLRFSNGKYVIEPHWNLFFRYFDSSSEFWWSDAVVVSAGEREYRFLSPEKDTLYNSFRIFSKAFIQLRFLVMVAEIIRHYERMMDWRLLFAYARELRFESVLRVILKLSQELLGAKIPREYSEIKKFRVKVLYLIAYRMALRGGSTHPLQKALLVCLRDDFPGVIRIMLRRIFPSMGEIVLRYGLPVRSFKTVVYYLLNPFILSFRGHHNKS